MLLLLNAAAVALAACELLTSLQRTTMHHCRIIHCSLVRQRSSELQHKLFFL